MPEKDSRIENKIKRLQKKFGMFDPELEPWNTVRDALQGMPEPTEQGTSQWNHHVFKDGARTYPGHTGSYIDEPSKTLKAGAHGVPGGENMIRYECGRVRYFSVRESARIQSFPDSYKFEGAWGEVMRQLGNAVPAELARIVGESVYSSLRTNTE